MTHCETGHIFYVIKKDRVFFLVSNTSKNIEIEFTLSSIFYLFFYFINMFIKTRHGFKHLNNKKLFGKVEIVVVSYKWNDQSPKQTKVEWTATNTFKIREIKFYKGLKNFLNNCRENFLK